MQLPREGSIVERELVYFAGSAVLDAFQLARSSYRTAVVVATHEADVKGFGATSYRLEAGALAAAP